MAKAGKLKKNLTLFDVFAISTGAMFSSGFFLLPGLATAESGPATILAYLIAGILIMPAMFSQAELATAMPRAGGTYYFLDRSLGPLVGTVGGLGTWLALVFKSAFALIGMGAYLVIFIELPMKPVAIGLTVAFTLLNIFGAKESSGLQRILVITLIGVLTFFIIGGLIKVNFLGWSNVSRNQLTPFMPFGAESILATIGLVFVSYAGLTKVASVAEEVQNPDRNIPLGMLLSLLTATLIYVVGVFIMISVLDPVELRSDLTPVATASSEVLGWLPGNLGLIIIVVAAIAAFASTGNAGIMSASRYPLAMARDRLVAQHFSKIGRFGTPVSGILITGAFMVLFIVIFSEQGVAKLASAFQLLIFGFLNLAVIIMRESKIESYVPGYKSPFYPWMQVFGILTAMILIPELGLLSMLFTVGIIGFGVLWYFMYSNKRVAREGAIYHLFSRLGKYRYEGLDEELRVVLKDKGFSDELPFERLIGSSRVIDLPEALSFEDVVVKASKVLDASLPIPQEEIANRFMEGSKYGMTPVSHHAALPHFRASNIDKPCLLIARVKNGVTLAKTAGPDEGEEMVYAMFFLVSPDDQPGEHLRVLSNLASRVDEDQFLDEWMAAESNHGLKEALLHHERYLSVKVDKSHMTSEWIGKKIRDLPVGVGTLIIFIYRNGQIMTPSGDTVLEEGDRLTITGEPKAIKSLTDQYYPE